MTKYWGKSKIFTNLASIRTELGNEHLLLNLNNKQRVINNSELRLFLEIIDFAPNFI